MSLPSASSPLCHPQAGSQQYHGTSCRLCCACTRLRPPPSTVSPRAGPRAHSVTAQGVDSAELAPASDPLPLPVYCNSPGRGHGPPTVSRHEVSTVLSLHQPLTCSFYFSSYLPPPTRFFFRHPPERRTGQPTLSRHEPVSVCTIDDSCTRRWSLRFSALHRLRRRIPPYLPAVLSFPFFHSLARR